MEHWYFCNFAMYIRLSLESNTYAGIGLTIRMADGF